VRSGTCALCQEQTHARSKRSVSAWRNVLNITEPVSSLRYKSATRPQGRRQKPWVPRSKRSIAMDVYNDRLASAAQQPLG
jgi:hypothetical protein